MTANDVIEAYVQDVAKQLPQAQRADVARELSALLQDELRGKAEAGELVDASAATAWVNAFGHPTQVAARYRPVFHVIDPADGRAFARLAIAGLLVIWVLGALDQGLRAHAAGQDLMRAVTQWWFSAVLPSFWWPGVLVMAYAGSAWVRRRWPDTEVWRPLDPDRLKGGRAAMCLAVVGVVAGLAALANPQAGLILLWGPNVSPQALEAFAYAKPFRQGPGPVVFALLALNIPLFLAAAAKGRWTPQLHRAEKLLSLLTVAALIWTLASGPIFLAQVTNQAMQLAMGLTVMGTLWVWVLQWRRAKALAGEPLLA
jgi:hypothetical protein